MQINPVEFKNILNNTHKRAVKSFSDKNVSVPKSLYVTSIAALSGMYIMSKALKEKANTKIYSDNDIKIKTTIGEKETYVHSMTREYTNSKTGKKETLNMELSDVAGVYNSTITDEFGNKRIESVGRKNPDGSVYVEKTLESLDGTKTHYVYNASKNNENIKMSYIVEDSNGEVLANIDRIFRRVDENMTYSSINGREFLIKKENDTFTITDLGEQKAINFKQDEIFYDENAKAHSEIIDKMSGDMLLDMYKRGYRYNYIDNADITEMEPCEKILSVKNDLFDFSHELGHTKDLEYSYDDDYNLNINYKISQNPDFRKVFEEERNAFIKNSSKIEQKYLDYFIDKENHYNEENGGAAEFIAEANALLSTSTGSGCNDHLCARDYYLQKYFPRSIAEASKLLF